MTAVMMLAQVLFQCIFFAESPTSNRLGRTTFAGGDHNEKLHDAVIDLATAALHDIDILVSHGDTNVDAGFTIGELAQVSFSGGGTQALTDSICKTWMRRAREDLHAPHLWR